MDADGLNAHAGRLELFREREAPTGADAARGRAGRLLDVGTEEVAPTAWRTSAKPLS